MRRATRRRRYRKGEHDAEPELHGRGDQEDAGGVPPPEHDELLQHPARDRPGRDAVRLRRRGAAVPGRIRGRRHHQRRALPPGRHPHGGGAGADAPAHDHTLLPPRNRRLREEARGDDAGGAEGELLHQQRVRGDRALGAFGEELHEAAGVHRPAPLVPRPHPDGDEPHRPVGVAPQPPLRLRRLSRPRRLLLPVPLLPLLSGLRSRLRAADRGDRQILHLGPHRGVHRRTDTGVRRRGMPPEGVFRDRLPDRPELRRASASPTRSRPASGAPATGSGGSSSGAACPTSSRWRRGSGTACRSAP